MNLVLKYFPDLSGDQIRMFEEMEPLYRHWNSLINVISRKDMDALYEKHILHSLSIARFIQFAPGTRILDAGTGGGFPGIPLAVLFPQVEFTLADSIAKKIRVVSEITASLGLTHIRATNVRVEQIPGSFHFIVSRAVTALPTLYGWVRKSVTASSFNSRPNGLIVLKGGNLNEELKPFRNQVSVISLQDYFEEEFFETKKLVYLPVE